MAKESSVDTRRLRVIGEGRRTGGPVVYWMSRDQRVDDNWALLHAQELSRQHRVPMAVLFCLVPEFLSAAIRHYGFMLTGLQEIEKKLGSYNIPFFLVTGRPERAIPQFVRRYGVGALITDFSPLKLPRKWKEAVAERIEIPLIEVDAHNIVPCRVASDKREYGAYTIRPKIHRLLPSFLTEFPRLRKHHLSWPQAVPAVDWQRARRSLSVDMTVKEVTWIVPGETAAQAMMREFLETKLADYERIRNDPTVDGQSNLSPYLHFGHISAQRVALEAQRYDRDIKSQEAFLEQLIIRRELSDNFCYYTHDYDSFDGFPEWARATHNAHRRDIRPYRYTRDQLAAAATHDDLWNAAQNEMVYGGKMHGYLRMYWAKKILEWSPSPEAASATAVYLNDRYELDGRDPNGYAGIAWSIGGVHDRPWFERDIFGKIRYMSYDGCRRKFDIPRFIARVEKIKAEAGA